MWSRIFLLIPVLVATLWKALQLDKRATRMDYSYFVGDYTLQTPGFYVSAGDNLDSLQFSLSPQGTATFPANLQKELDSDNIQTQVSLDLVNQELGSICRIRWIWSNDASTELYEIGLMRQGPGVWRV